MLIRSEGIIKHNMVTHHRNLSWPTKIIAIQRQLNFTFFLYRDISLPDYFEIATYI